MVVKLGNPQPKQELFMKSTAKHTGYGGARGGGKSWSVREKAKFFCFRYGGIKVLIVRRTYPELNRNHILPLRQQLAGIAKYNASDKMFTFPNGSTITFGYCKNDADLDQYQGTEYDIIFFDEATHLTEYQLKIIAATNRGVNIFPKRIYYTCNPGGPGHAYIKRIFVDKVYVDKEKPEDYTFIQALVDDNKILMEMSPDYVDQLDNLPTQKRKAWREGLWDIFEGQFFEEFTDSPQHYKDRQFTHVIEPFDIPPSWRIYRSFDWGFRKPFSCDWWAVDHEGRAYLIYQYYGCTGVPNEGVKMNPHEVFKEIRRYERELKWLKGKRIEGVADPAIWNSQTGESIAEIADMYGVYFNKGDNSRLNGWMQCHYRMNFDKEGYPMVYFFNTCKDAIRVLQLLQYSEKKVEDLDTDQEDHFADSFRYFCMARPLKASEIPEAPPTPFFDALNLSKKGRRS